MKARDISLTAATSVCILACALSSTALIGCGDESPREAGAEGAADTRAVASDTLSVSGDNENGAPGLGVRAPSLSSPSLSSPDDKPANTSPKLQLPEGGLKNAE